jgi:hypothetical protein
LIPKESAGQFVQTVRVNDGNFPSSQFKHAVWDDRMEILPAGQLSQGAEPMTLL